MLLFVGGCTCNKLEGEPIARPISGSPSLGATPAPDPVAEAQDEVNTREAEALRLLGAPRWAGETDGGAAPSASVTGPDPRALAEKEARDRADTEEAVNAALNAVQDRLRGCYQSSQGGSTGQTTLRVRLRVHRLGYLLDSSIEGAGDAVRRCLEGVIGSLRVQGVKTDTITVERSFNFHTY